MKDTGGPAFPIMIDDVRDFSSYKDNDLTGMTLRDFFAGQALAGILAGRYWEVVRIDNPAAASYELADAMIAERNK